MSQPYSRYLHPFEATRRPSVEPEVEKAILASLGAGNPARAEPDKTDARRQSRRRWEITTLQ